MPASADAKGAPHTTSDLSANGAGAAERAPVSYAQPATISTGDVALQSPDVGQLRFDVQKVVDVHSGTITDENTETDQHGAVVRSRLVVRVPSSDFGATMSALEKAGELLSSTRKSEDVSTQVIDLTSRVQAQAASVRRIRLLLGRANSINEIMSIESELTQRQGALDSLRRQAAYLRDQTTFSTITVSLEQTPPTPVPKPVKHHDSGFLAGLHRGWDGLASFGNGAATALGLVLPTAVLLTLIGVPVLLITRRWRPTAGRNAT